MAPAPTSHFILCEAVCAMTMVPCSCALVVVIVRLVAPLAVTVDGEKTQAAPWGSPEHENETIPVNPLEGEMVIVLGPVVWPLVTVSA
jgi:hypothetical protein